MCTRLRSVWKNSPCLSSVLPFHQHRALIDFCLVIFFYYLLYWVFLFFIAVCLISSSPLALYLCLLNCVTTGSITERSKDCLFICLQFPFGWQVKYKTTWNTGCQTRLYACNVWLHIDLMERRVQQLGVFGAHCLFLLMCTLRVEITLWPVVPLCACRGTVSSRAREGQRQRLCGGRQRHQASNLWVSAVISAHTAKLKLINRYVWGKT